MALFNPSHGFIQYGEGRYKESDRHLASIRDYNTLATKKRKVVAPSSGFTSPIKGAATASWEKAAHPTDVAPNLLNWTNLYNRHIGCFIKDVPREMLPLKQFKPGVITALHHISSSLPIALSSVFPNDSTETHRKLFLHVLHFAVLAMSKGDLKVTEVDYFDPPLEDEEETQGAPKGDSPVSSASVHARTEDSTDQAGNRASDVCFESRSVFSKKFYSTFLNEEKGDDKPLAGSTPQWTGYCAPKLVKLLEAPPEETRALDLAGSVTSSKEWVGHLARPLAWLYLTPSGLNLQALPKAPERLKEAETHLKELTARVARVSAEFPNVQYHGPFLVFDVLVTPSSSFLSFPLTKLSPNQGCFEYLRFFLSSTFKNRVTEWTPDYVYELYGAAWASQHLRSAILTYTSVEKAEEWADKELTLEGVRALFPADILRRVIIDPLRHYREPSASPLTEASTSAAAKGPWWEASTLQGFVKSIAALSLSEEGSDQATRLRKLACALVVDLQLDEQGSNRADPALSKDEELALQVVHAAKWLIVKKEKKKAIELLQALVELG